MENITIKINGREVSAPQGSTILEAARLAQIEIPTLCYLKEINEIGACRMCVVEVKGARTLVTACVYPINEGMEVWTNTPKVIESRRKTLQLLLSNHDRKCLSCVRSGNCELQTLCREYKVDDEAYYDGERNVYELDTSAAHMVRDNNKCILCRRCSAVCEKVQGIGVIGANERGFKTYIGSAFDMDLAEISCVSCGQCIAVCPTGAIYEKDNTEEVFAAIADPEKYVVVQCAPAVRAGLGEAFGMPIGTDVEGKLAAALRRLGFDKVFDTTFSADLTIMEEANEFLDRVQNGGKLPLITSCSPGWIKYCEHYFPEMTENLSSCKSPQQMFGAIAKSYYAEKMGIPKEKMVVVSVMPCTAKKFEIGRDDENGAGVPDVDIAITTRELGRMIERASIRFADLPDEEFDMPLGLGTGAAVIFGATGGVMEAALRTVYRVLEGKEAPADFYQLRPVRGLNNRKEAEVSIAGKNLRVCILYGTAAAEEFLAEDMSGYHFVEVMTCPGGCISGAGQPDCGSVPVSDAVRKKRIASLYQADERAQYRNSMDNPEIGMIYNEFFKEPLSLLSETLLHTTYKSK